MRTLLKRILGAAICAPLLLANEGGCNGDSAPSSVRSEQDATNLSQQQLLRSQPIPVFDYSLERHMLIELYKARQRATNTYSFVQSEYTGRVLWSCNSLGYPLPYATQLTNPLQGITIFNRHDQDGSGVVNQAEPNGLYSPSQSDATWVPCLAPNGKIIPVYEEKHVTVFLQPMQEQDGHLVPVAGAAPSFSIDGK